jgi:hypothetical protein
MPANLRIIAARIAKPPASRAYPLFTPIPTSASFRQQPARLHTLRHHPSNSNFRSRQEIRLSGATWSTAFVVCFAVGASVGITIGILRPSSHDTTSLAKEEAEEEILVSEAMAAGTMPPGRPGNLTPEQEVKLRELWALALRVFGVIDSPANDLTPNGKSTPPSLSRQSSDHSSPDPAKRKKGRLSMFRKKQKDGLPEDFADSETSTSTSTSTIGGSGTSTPGKLTLFCKFL